MEQETEYQVFRKIFQRLGLLIDYGIDDGTLDVAGYYDMNFKFDDKGNLTEIETHP